MAWEAIRRATFEVTIDGTTTAVYWHDIDLGALDLWFYDADALFAPVWEWTRAAYGAVNIAPSYGAATVGILSECDTMDDMNALTDLCNNSIAAKVPGKLTLQVGNSTNSPNFLRCYMVPRAISDWQYKEGFLRQEFDIVPVDGFWWRDSGNWVIQPGAYGQITVDSHMGADIGITFEATAGTNPSVTVSPQSSSTSTFTNVYGFTAADVGEAFISTRDKVATIDGANAYDKRMGGAMGSGSYIFEPLPLGVHRVTNNSTGVARARAYKRLAAPRWS